MSLFSQFLYGSDTVIQGLLLVLLLRGGFRKYTAFAVYVLGGFIASICETTVYYRQGWESPAYRTIYWADRVTTALLLFLVVIAFTYAALQGNPLRPKAAKAALGMIVAVTLALPFAMRDHHRSKVYGFFTSQWFNHANQAWSFGAAIMNLVLWTALLSNRRRDPQLVTLSIGVGLATTSAALAWGVRQWFAPANRWPVDAFMEAADVASLLLWCWAFRPKADARPESGPS
jgi:hypothetical protein